MSRRTHSRGFILPLSVFLIFLSLGLGWALFRISRQNLHTALFYSKKEKAYHLARASAELLHLRLKETLRFLNSGKADTFPKLARAPEAYRPLLTWMLDSSGLLKESPGDLNLDIPGWDELSKSYPGSTVKGVLEILAPRRIYQTNPGSLRMDQREMEFFFRVNIHVDYEGVKSELTRFSRAKYIRITPHILSKFVLFISEPPLEGLNQILESRTIGSQQNSPVVVHPGPNLQQQPFGMSPDEIAQLMDESGWISLQSLSEITIGLGRGGGLSTIQDSFSESSMILRNMQEMDGVGTIFSEDGKTSYFLRRLPLFQELKGGEEKEIFSLESPQRVSKGSIFRLFGSWQAPSPGLVLGPVSRRFAIVQGFFQMENSRFSPLPFLTPAAYAQTTWPGIDDEEAVEVLKMHFEEIPGDPYQNYSSRMSRLIEEDYNAALLDLARTSSNEITIAPPASLPPLKRLLSAGADVRFDQRIHSQSLTILESNGKVLYENGDLRELKDLSFLESRVGIYFENEEQFFQRLVRGSALEISGVVQVKSNFRISQPLVVEEGGGGMILCDGDVEISAPIDVPAGETLVIISLHGDISMRVSSPTRLSLIAMEGSLEMPVEFSIEGSLAARNVKIPMAGAGTNRTLRYNSSLDITNSQNYMRGFRLQWDEIWRQYVQ